MRPFVSLIIVSVLIGCRAPSSVWDGQVYQWGTMREVLGQGQSQARVILADVVKRPHAYGLGAVANLDGEITIHDGHSTIGHVNSDGVAKLVSDSITDQATLLAVAYVASWQDVLLTEPIPSNRIDSTVRQLALTAGLDVDRPFPFLIVGVFDVEGHIINGSCPRAAAAQGSTGLEPLRFAVNEEKGIAVGFYAENGAGSLVHHGSVSHIHVIVNGDTPISGHVDSLSLSPGVVLRLPVLAATK